jgi:hypothetical protein
LIGVMRSCLFGGFAPVAGPHGFEPAVDDRFRLAHDARDEFGAAWDVVNQSLQLSDPLHAALHDRMLDARQFGKSRPDHCRSLNPLPSPRVTLKFRQQDAVTTAKCPS